MVSGTVEAENLIDPYASRFAKDWQAVDRPDPVVWGNGEGPLPEQELREYNEQGFGVFPQLFTGKEARTLLAEARELASLADPTADDVIVEPGNRSVRSLFRIHRTNEVFRKICQDPRITEIARQILGSEVSIHQSRINFKPAFSGKEFFWHSDFETWHVEDGMPQMRAISFSINLSENHEFNGPLMVIDGSQQLYIRCVGETPDDHFKGSLRKQEYGVPSKEALRLLIERGSGIHTPKGMAGSATMFDCNTMHGSVGNISPYPRTNLFLVYNSVENALVEPFGGKPSRPEFLAEREAVPIGEL